MDVQVAIGDIVLNQEGGAEDKKAKARENRVLKTEACNKRIGCAKREFAREYKSYRESQERPFNQEDC